MQIHVARDGKQLGVFSLEEIKRQLADGTLNLSDQAWYEGAPGWAALSTVPGVSAVSGPGSAPQISPAPGAAAPMALPPKKTEPLAIMSLVFSGIAICGFCCGLFIVAAIAGVVCGHLALAKIKANPELEGHGLAMSGIIVGYVAIGLVLIRVLFFGGLAALGAFSHALSKP
ncbi:MAG: DUF4190 domain-containing protein [Verrucomicrobiota bacterium]|nr:DUF4190 domain-containing protein [Verrucomicrobiota bacterium]